MADINLSNFIVGFILVLTVGIILVGAIGDLTLEYGINETTLVDDDSIQCSVTETIESINSINALFQNESILAVTYAPGQENAPVDTNLVTATQSSGLVTTLKLVGLVMVLPKTFLTDLGCAIGLPPVLITAIQVIFAVIILMLIAGLFYFRKV